MPKKNLAILYYENNFDKFYQISKKLKKNYNIIFISTSFFDSITNLSLSEKKLRKKNEISYSFKEELLHFHKSIEKNFSELSYLNYFRYFEKKFLKKKIKDLIKYDYFLSQENNPREDVLFHPNKKKKYYLVYLILKKIEQIIVTHKIDIFFSMTAANFINNCLFYYSQNNKKLFVTTVPNRFGEDTSFSDNFGFAYPKYLKSYNRFILSEKHFASFKKEIDDLLLNSTNNISPVKSLFLGISNEIARFFILILNIRNFINRERDNFKLKKLYKCETKYYYQRNQAGLFIVHLRYVLRSLYLHIYIFLRTCKIGFIFRNKYIYIPLHYFPEAFVYNQNNFNELKMVNTVLKNTPENILIILKPHPNYFKNFFEQHKSNYYKKMIINNRVKIVSPYICSIFLIKNAFATISFIGTAMLQSILLNKQAFSFGMSELNYFNGIKHFNNKYFKNNCVPKKVNNIFNYKLLYSIKYYSINNNKKLLSKNNLLKLETVFNYIVQSKNK
jgi:hypothetical protein